MAGPVGRQARLDLTRVTVPGSPAAAAIADLPLATPPPSSPAARLRASGTVVVVGKVRMLSRTRALVYLRAFDYGAWTSRAASGRRARTRTSWTESVHRIVVVRDHAGRWLVTEDLSSVQPPAGVTGPAATQLASGPTPSTSPSGNMAISGSPPPNFGSPAPSPTATTPLAPTPTPTTSGASP